MRTASCSSGISAQVVILSPKWEVLKWAMMGNQLSENFGRLGEVQEN